MPLIILAALIGIPLIELYILIAVGGSIGAFSTIILCLLTAGIGLTLVRAQGLDLMRSIDGKVAADEPIGMDILHGLMLLVAGLVLMFPGFATDVLGGLLLLPPVRAALIRVGLVGHLMTFRSKQGGTKGSPGQRPTIIIEGDIVTNDEDQSGPR